MDDDLFLEWHSRIMDKEQAQGEEALTSLEQKARLLFDILEIHDEGVGEWIRVNSFEHLWAVASAVEEIGDSDMALFIRHALSFYEIPSPETVPDDFD